MVDKLDVIIFGATGFTGKYTVYEAISVLQNVRWGVAGRNREKLETVLADMGTKAGKSLKHIPIIIADIDDESSLVAMSRRCRVLVNCCGPYRFYGERVVRACIENGTHHVDVSGEPQYMETMQLKYNKLAQDNNVYVVSACGFDSIPADMGVIFIEKNFDGIVNSVETYLHSYTRGISSTGGAAINYGTWKSAVYGLAHANELREIRTQLFPYKLSKFNPILKHRPLMFRSDVINGICLPFPGSDRSVVMRSQRFLFEQEHKRPIQMQAYIAFDSWLSAAFVAFVALIFGMMTKFSFGRQLLLKYPKFFSGGLVSRDGPTESRMENTYFSMTMKAIGWAQVDGSGEEIDKMDDPPPKSLMVRLSGQNPGYGVTCVAVLSAAIIILKESDKMPSTGGVLPPGAAFAKTSMISELEKHEHGVKFEILANK